MTATVVPEDPWLASLALGEAVSLSRPDLINLLLRKHGSSFADEILPGEVKNVQKGDTALHLACRLGRVDAVRTLLRSGAAVNVRNEAGKLPLELMKESSFAPQVEQAFMAELLQNVCSGQVTRIERLLSGGIDVTKSDGSRDQATLLHWAAAFGQGREVINLLVKGGADPNIRNKAGATPAHEASSKGAVDTLEALRDCGANFSIKDAKGKTPRDLAQGPEVIGFFDSLQNDKQIEASTAATLISPKTQIQKKAPPGVSTKNEVIDKSTLVSSHNGLDAHQSERNTNSLSSPESISSSSSLQVERTLRRKHEEQDALIESLRSTIDGMLREHGVQDYVARLQEHVGALTRQLAATAEQRDKLQNLYVANDRELERLARELALSKSMSPLATPRKITSQASSESLFLNTNGNSNANEKVMLGRGNELEELRIKCAELSEELERERKEGYAAARLHLTYEADLRAEIKALQEQMLTDVGNAAMGRETENRGLLSSLISW